MPLSPAGSNPSSLKKEARYAVAMRSPLSPVPRPSYSFEASLSRKFLRSFWLIEGEDDVVATLPCSTAFFSASGKSLAKHIQLKNKVLKKNKEVIVVLLVIICLFE